MMIDQPLTIIHTESHRAWGGQEIRVLNECIWMRKKGHRTLLLAAKESQIYSKAKEAGQDVLPMTFDGKTAVFDVVRLRRLLKKYTPDVLNTHGNMDAKIGLLAALGLGIPCVIRSRHHSHPVSPSWHNKILYRHLSHYIFTSAQCITEQIIRDLGVAAAKVVTVSSGVTPPDIMQEKKQARFNLQDSLQIDQRTRFIGSVARLSDWKGHRYIIEAFTAIADQFPLHHLVIVGDGSEMEKLKSQARQSGFSGRIHLLGFKKNPWPFFRAFDMHILASTKNEGNSQTIPQAMISKCPAIGTKAGGTPELIEDKETGLLVDAADSVALAHAMAAILNNPEKTKSMTQKAYTVAMSKYTNEVMINRILWLYQQAFTGACPRG